MTCEMKHRAPDGKVHTPFRSAPYGTYSHVVLARRRYPHEPYGEGTVVAWCGSESMAKMRSQNFAADPDAWIEPINGGGEREMTAEEMTYANLELALGPGVIA